MPNHIKFLIFFSVLFWFFNSRFSVLFRSQQTRLGISASLQYRRKRSPLDDLRPGSGEKKLEKTNDEIWYLHLKTFLFTPDRNLIIKNHENKNTVTENMKWGNILHVKTSSAFIH